MNAENLMMYQKEDVLPYMGGMWKDALQSVCGLSPQVFNKKHQPCPHCGGKDRFRWTDNLDKPGDGGAICNSCGNDTGIGWMMKLTGEPYSEVINILGRFLGKVPQEYRITKNKQASRSTGYNFGAQVEHEKCLAVMERTDAVVSTPLSVYEGISLPDGEWYFVGKKPREIAADELIHAIPCRLVHDDGPDDEFCNILFIDESGNESFYAKRYTPGSVVVNGNTEGAIYLCSDWIASQHARIFTGQEIWTCFSPYNIEIVAFRYKGPREIRVICHPHDRDSIIAAEERQLKVLLPVDGDFKKGIMKKIFDPASLL